MDPSVFLQFTPPHGLPQESKLVTYMNRSLLTPTSALSQAFGKINLESAQTPSPMNHVYGMVNTESQQTPTSSLCQAFSNINMESQQTPTSLCQAFSTINMESQQTPTSSLCQAFSTINMNSPQTPSSSLCPPFGAMNMENQQTPSSSLCQAFGTLNMESPQGQSLQIKKLTLESQPMGIKKVLVGEFVPLNYYNPATIIAHSPENSPPDSIAAAPPNTQVHQENVGGTTYFYASNTEGLNTSGSLNSSASIAEPCHGGPVGAAAAPVASPYATQMFSGTPTHIPPPSNKPGLAATFYTPETIRAEIYERNADVYLHTDLRQFPDLPENVEMYSELTPLEGAVPHAMTTSFRATHRQSGSHYALRRLHSHPGSKRLEHWKKIDHPNVVKMHHHFTTKAFNDLSAVVVYDYHPGCVTLRNKFLSGGTHAVENNTPGPAFHDPFSSDPDAPRPYTHQKNAMLRAVASGALLPESVLWSVIVQLTAALRAIHGAGLACRSLDPTKVVMNGCRVRISWCGTADVLHNTLGDVGQAQQEDLNALGRLALSLACRTMHCENLPASMELVARTYSSDLKNLILYLLSSSPARRSVTDLMPMIGARFYTQVEALERRSDVFEEQLAHEIDNGRLLHILIKMGIVNERPELNMDASWSETGDRYMLKLFRDYIFHSVTEDGRPWLDQAHLAYCLNNLDGGTNSRVGLMSRDEQSFFVVSFAELKHCLEQSFDEVMQAAAPTQ